MSLWVVLMVPVSAFAALVALAGPQRIAAESTMQEATDDLAEFAAVWRIGNDQAGGALPAFPPECARDESQRQVVQDEIDRLQGLVENPLTDPNNVPQLEADRDAEVAKLTNWDARWDDVEAMCDMFFESVVRDLGYLGVEVGSVRGFYSDSLLSAEELPCRAGSVVVLDAVYVALAADWANAGWASAQVWPGGMRVAAASIGRASRATDSNADAGLPVCPESLRLFDEQGRLILEPGSPWRTLVESVPRTAVSG
ncbi:hypothetical protein [Candidatus Poriferisodalis sp.]|uniref:hypothetical protein n=1 Tax=Candidatus Poriferisodalis sp. TaxID=3101277 RepID=UPI003B51B4B6